VLDVALPGDLRRVLREGLREELRRAIREELTSGDAAAPRTLSPILLEALAEALREEVGRRAAENKASLFNASVSADTNVFPEDLKPTNAPCIFRIYACFDAPGVLSVVRTRGGATTTEALNGGDPLVAGAAYVFDVIVDEGESVNLRYSADATALKLSVVEIGAMA